MIKQNRKHRRSSGLDYAALENRQVLTSIMYDQLWIQNEAHIPVNESHAVIQHLNEAPEISLQPENGTLTYDESAGTLIYQPDDGFVGADNFQAGSRSFTMRVWHSAWATPDWAHVISGESTSIDVLDNDYSLKNESASEALTYSFNDQFMWRKDSTGFSIVGVTDPDSGSILIADDGRSLIFEAADGFVGQQEVTYTIEDSRGFRSSGKVVLDVTGQAVDSRSYVSEAEWQQGRIESWMERNASSLTWGGMLWTYSDVLGGEVVASGTNNDFQVSEYADVQSGDIVKSHGDLLYYATYGDGDSEFQSYLSIVDVSNPSDPMLLSTTGFDSNIADIFLDEGRVAVVLTESRGFWNWSWNGAQFELQVLDVTSPVVPTEVYSATVDGTYSDARLIGDHLHLVSQYDSNTGNSPWDILSEGVVAVSPGDYIDAVLAQDGFALPEVIVEVGEDSKAVSIPVDQVLRRESGYASTLVTTFNVQDDSGEPTDMDLIQSDRVSTVYFNAQSLYLFDNSSVIKLSIDADSSVQFSADGTLEGTLLNQFSADEHDGMLRVALTDSNDGSSDVRVFEQVGDSLNVVGSLDDIAPGERIFSTTFVADQVFVVTFRQIDPLFVIDLSDATAPTITGELKIPGVSNYLQLIDDDILLAVGRDADPVSGMQTDLQVSLFDVADPTNPQLLDRYTFEGGRSTRTPLTDWLTAKPDHHALTFDQFSGTLALPIQSWFGSEAKHEVSVFNISRAEGIQNFGSVSFGSQAQRTVISGDRVVYLSDDSLKTAMLSDSTTVIASLELPPEESKARGLGAAERVCRLIDRVFEETVAPVTVEEVEVENEPFDVETDTVDFVADVRELLTDTVEFDVDHVSGWLGQFFELLDVVSVNDVLPPSNSAALDLPLSTQFVNAIEANSVMTDAEKEIALENVELAVSDIQTLMDDFSMSFGDALHDYLDRTLPDGFPFPFDAIAEQFIAQMTLHDQLDEIAVRHGLSV